MFGIEVKKIRTITEKKKIKIVDKKLESFKSDHSDGKFSSAPLSSVGKSSKSNEKEKKATKSFSGYTKVTRKPLSIMKKCLHFLFGIARKIERVKIFFGENAIQDPIFRLTHNGVKTTK